MKRILPILLVFLLLWGCNRTPHRDEIIIAMLDTGLSTTAIRSETLLDGWNYVTNTADTEDRINHGTAVASVILGCESAKIEANAPNANVVPLVVTDKIDGSVKSVSPDVLAKAIRDSVDKYDACIINVSLGIQTDNADVRKAIQYAQKKGALVIASVGNDGESTTLYYPAAYDDVLGVGSHDKELIPSDFSQQNGTADILAPGEDIWLASRNGKTYGARGTSYATGYVSAAAFEIWQEQPTLNAKEVQDKLLSSATDVDGHLILNLE